LPPFAKWSKDQPLLINELRLRFNDWVELIPLGAGNDDINAISSKFFQLRGKSKTPRLQLNKVLLMYLEISYETYCQVSERLDELQLEDIHNQPITESECKGDDGQNLPDSGENTKATPRKRQISVQ
jgi:hypothetical protein